MRRSELASLTWNNIDLQRRSATLLDTKNGDRRDVPLSPTAISILRLLPHSITGLVFDSSANAITCAWKRCLARARQTYIEECRNDGSTLDPKALADLRFHDLRHEAITRLAGKLTNVLELAAVSGHRTLQTLKTYYNPTVEELASKLA